MSTTLNLSLASSVNVAAGPQTLSPWRNPTQLEHPSFLLCFPFSYSTEVPNNPWMTVDDNRRQPNHKRAAIQFLELYRYLASEALVHILPTPREANLQDQLYTANLGIVLEHMEDKNTVVISNFTSDPRRGEAQVGFEFFRQMGYKIWVPPTKFEGEAELKHLHENVYAGGYGIRSEKETYQWMEENFDCTSSSFA